MTSKVLVTYASRYGSTAEVAQFIGNKLSAKPAFSVTTQSVADVEAIEPYDIVIVGGAIYSGKWPDELVTFVETMQSALQTKRTALFVLALRLRDNNEDMRQSVLGTVSTQVSLLKPLTAGLFAGKLDYDTLSPIVKLQIKTKNLPQGDFRDWEKIDAWIDELVAKLET